MYSKLIKENVQPLRCALERQTHEMLARTGLAFYGALRSGDDETLRKAYKQLSEAVRIAEQKTGIRIIETPDGGCMAALTALAGIFEAEAEAAAAAARPVPGTVTFCSVSEANAWLMSHPNVVPNRLHVETDTRVGLLANHAQARNITIDYTDRKKPTGYVYGMCEEEMTSYFLKGNTEEQKRRWAEAHPGLEQVMISWASNSRGAVGAAAFGVGVIENKQFFIVYRLTHEEAERRAAAVRAQQPVRQQTVPTQSPVRQNVYAEPQNEANTQPAKKRSMLAPVLIGVIGGIAITATILAVVLIRGGRNSYANEHSQYELIYTGGEQDVRQSHTGGEQDVRQSYTDGERDVPQKDPESSDDSGLHMSGERGGGSTEYKGIDFSYEQTASQTVRLHMDNRSDQSCTIWFVNTGDFGITVVGEDEYGNTESCVIQSAGGAPTVGSYCTLDLEAEFRTLSGRIVGVRILNVTPYLSSRTTVEIRSDR